MSTLTLSRVMMPWDWMGMVTIRSDTRHSRSITGMISRSPGSRTAITRPSRKWTPRSYCLTTRRADASSNAAETTAAVMTETTTPVVMSASLSNGSKPTIPILIIEH